MLGLNLIPHITEKTNSASEHGWYSFRVPTTTGKISLKDAVQDRYGVIVTRVRMIPVRPREIRLGRTIGQVPGFKKAMVKLAAGQTIDFT